MSAWNTARRDPGRAGWAFDGHKAAFCADEFDLSQRVPNKEMAFSLVYDRRCARFNQENAHEFASFT
jgi:hypothetical protein